MASIDNMVSNQPGIIPQVTGDLIHTRFWATTVFVYYYSDYCYAHLMRGTSSEETLRSKEAHESLTATHGDRVCTYREDNRRFVDPLFKEAVQTCGQQISYCRVGTHHQKAIVDISIKELTLGY